MTLAPSLPPPPLCLSALTAIERGGLCPPPTHPHTCMHAQRCMAHAASCSAPRVHVHGAQRPLELIRVRLSCVALHCAALCVTARRYFKRISVPELELVGLPLAAAALTWSHAHATLVVSYAKPAQVLAQVSARPCTHACTQQARWEVHVLRGHVWAWEHPTGLNVRWMRARHAQSACMQTARVDRLCKLLLDVLPMHVVVQTCGAPAACTVCPLPGGMHCPCMWLCEQHAYMW